MKWDEILNPTVCTIEQKLSVLQRLDDKGESVVKLASEIAVGVTTIKDWRKNCKDIDSFLLTIHDEKSLKFRLGSKIGFIKNIEVEL